MRKAAAGVAIGLGAAAIVLAVAALGAFEAVELTSYDWRMRLAAQDPPYEFPNGHDYEQLEIIYGHTDSYNSYTGGSTGGGSEPCNAPPGKGCNKAGAPQDPPGNAWGISLGRKGQKEKFLRVDRDGTRHITFVTWVQGH